MLKVLLVCENCVGEEGCPLFSLFHYLCSVLTMLPYLLVSRASQDIAKLAVWLGRVILFQQPNNQELMKCVKAAQVKKQASQDRRNALTLALR